MVAITLFIPNIFSRFCNARQIDCKLAKLVYIGWKMYKLAFHDHYSNNCSFRAKMTKRNGIKLTDRVLCRRRSTAIQSSCCYFIPDLLKSCFTFRDVKTFYSFQFTSKEATNSFWFSSPRVNRIKHKLPCNSRLKIPFQQTCLMKIIRALLQNWMKFGHTLGFSR